MSKHVSTYGKPLSDLSDKELAEEAERRRKRRARGRNVSRSSRSSSSHGAVWQMSEEEAQRILKFYASLELSPGATREDIEESYRRLTKKYHPHKHKDNPDKHRAALELSESLTSAYDALIKHLDRK